MEIISYLSDCIFNSHTYILFRVRTWDNLMPVFTVFFPIDIAIALTGIVHFSNNLFKITLVGKNADKVVY